MINGCKHELNLNTSVVVRPRQCQVLNIVNIIHEKVESLQHTNYDPDDATHVALLETLWTSLQPDARRTDGWAPLGFQNGDKPETDFRGMGLLGKTARL